MHPNARLPQGGSGPVGPQGPPLGTIVLQIQGNALTSSMVPPSVQVDGHGFSTGYGENPIQVPAGRRHVFVWSQWMRTYGQAHLDVDVPPGGAVRVYYRAPMHQFTEGSIGFEPQKARGMGCFWAMLGVLLAFVVVVVAAAALLG